MYILLGIVYKEYAEKDAIIGELGVFQLTAYRCRCGHDWVPKNLRQLEQLKC